jgi:hypothetical protein
MAMGEMIAQMGGEVYLITRDVAFAEAQNYSLLLPAIAAL